MSHWGVLLAEITQGMAEVVIVGPETEDKRAELSRHHLPFALMMGATSKSELPLFEGRNSTDSETRIYVCFNKTCKLPVESSEEAIRLILRN